MEVAISKLSFQKILPLAIGQLAAEGSLYANTGHEVLIMLLSHLKHPCPWTILLIFLSVALCTVPIMALAFNTDVEGTLAGKSGWGSLQL